jgi:hypothetical protein
MHPADEGASPAHLPSGPRAVAALARDLADFLVEFSIVLHKRAMYPAGHPHLQESAERFVDRLESLLATRDSLAIGVARHQLIVAEVADRPAQCPAQRPRAAASPAPHRDRPLRARPDAA